MNSTTNTFTAKMGLFSEGFDRMEGRRVYLTQTGLMPKIENSVSWALMVAQPRVLLASRRCLTHFSGLQSSRMGYWTGGGASRGEYCSSDTALAPKPRGEGLTTK